MSRLPPATPFLPNLKYGGDESLLLGGEPVFGDITLDEADFFSSAASSSNTFRSPAPGTLRQSQYKPVVSETRLRSTDPPSCVPHRTEQAGRTLDLNAYLPGEETAVQDDTTLRAQEADGPEANDARLERSSSGSSAGSMKREGGDTPLRLWTKPKKAKPPTPVRDDLYSCRVSDSNRRGSFGVASPAIATPEVFPNACLRSSSSSSSLKGGVLGASLSPSASRETVDGLAGGFRGPTHVEGPPGITADMAEIEVLNGDNRHPGCGPTIASTTSGTPEGLSGSASSHKSLLSASLSSYSLLRRSLSLNFSNSEAPSVSTPGAPQTGEADAGGDRTALSFSTSSPSSVRKVFGSFHTLLRRSSTVSSGGSRAEGIERGKANKGSGRKHDQERETPADTQDSPANRTKVDSVSTQGDGAVPPISPSRLAFPTRPMRPPYYVAPLTRSISPPRATAARALKPARTVPSATADSSRSGHSSSSVTNVKSKAPPVTTSAFASAALARLPPAGKGASAAGKPVQVRDTERAKDLLSMRNVFERLASNSSNPAPRPRPPGPNNPLKPATAAGKPNLPRTVPISGHTPGKASLARAKERERFDAAVKGRMEEKERERREKEEKEKEKEEMGYRERRKETVIWAKPLPEMYARKA